MVEIYLTQRILKLLDSSPCRLSAREIWTELNFRHPEKWGPVQVTKACHNLYFQNKLERTASKSNHWRMYEYGVKK